MPNPRPTAAAGGAIPVGVIDPAPDAAAGLRETHVGVVVMIGDKAYQLKKAVLHSWPASSAGKTPA